MHVRHGEEPNEWGWICLCGQVFEDPEINEAWRQLQEIVDDLHSQFRICLNATSTYDVIKVDTSGRVLC